MHELFNEAARNELRTIRPLPRCPYCDRKFRPVEVRRQPIIDDCPHLFAFDWWHHVDVPELAWAHRLSVYFTRSREWRYWTPPADLVLHINEFPVDQWFTGWKIPVSSSTDQIGRHFAPYREDVTRYYFTSQPENAARMLEKMARGDERFSTETPAWLARWISD